MKSTPPTAPLVFGPYRLLEHVASGGMAEVYVARREGPHGFHKTVAVKRILPQLVQDEDFVAMFVGEAQVAATLSHPNIVQVFDFGEQDGELYMAMEYVRGTNVARITRRAAARGITVPLDVTLHIILSVLRGLEYAHGARDESGKLLRLIHRDVSPSNVLIDESGDVKLTDFGIARAATVERRTISGHLKGKLGYMSPEQVMGLELDARSDLFTLGIVFAELLTLRPLFMGPSEIETLTRIRDADVRVLRDESLPPDVLTVLLRSLAKLPDVRYPGARAFADDIEELARQRGISLGAPRLAAFLASLGGYSWHPPEIHDAPTSRLGVPPPGALLALAEMQVQVDGGSPPSSATLYRVELADHSILGPFKYPQLAELFATGAAGSSSRVSRAEGPFEPPQTFAELSRFVTSGALVWEGDDRWSQRSRRPINRMTFPGWLFRLAAGRKTGAILLRDGQRRKKVYLVDGAPEFSSSTDKRELLGEHLIARGGVLRVEIEMALSMLPRFGGRLGDALVGLGVLRPVELVRAIHAQTVERYLELFCWRDGESVFDAGAASGEEAFPLGAAPFDLVGRGVRDSYAHAEMAGWLAGFGDAPLSVAPHPHIRRDVLRWTAAEDRALAALGTAAPVDDFIRRESARVAVGPEEAVRAVFLGLTVGVLELPGFVVPE